MITKKNNNSDTFPLSKNQLQFWMISNFYPDCPVYNIPTIFKIIGNLNINYLKKSLSGIINRHKILQTTFSLQGLEPIQRIRPKKDIPFTIIDLKQTSLTTKIKKKEKIINNIINESFNLENGPLIRIQLITLEEKENILIIVMHHIIVDLHSKNLFAKELAEIYNSLLNQKLLQLKKNPPQYADYAIWQQKWLSSDDFKKKLLYWGKKLANKNDYLNLPIDKNRPPIQTLNGKEVPLNFSKEFTKKIKEFSKLHSITPFITLLAAYYILFFKLSGQTEIIVGIPLTNRQNKEDKDTLGCFMNIIPLIIKLTNNSKFKDVIRSIRVTLLEAHRNQQVPFSEIIQKENYKRNPAYNSLFQVGFTFEQPLQLSLGDLVISPIIKHSNGSQLDLFATFWESNDRLSGRFEFNTDLFYLQTIQKFIKIYNSILKYMVSSKNINNPLSSYNLLN